MSGPVIFAIAAALLVDGFALYGATLGNYPASANVFPFLAAGALTILAVSLRFAGPEPDAEGVGPARLSPSAVLWLVALVPVLYVLGFRVGLPIYALSYGLANGLRPLPSVALAGGVAVVVEVLFVRILERSLPAGWLAEMVLS